MRRPLHLNATPLALTALTAALMLLCISCGTSRKVGKLVKNEVAVNLRLANEDREPAIPVVDSAALAIPVPDELTVTDDDGREILLMKAIRDDETGEMVANEVIQASYVSARFRNVAERHGFVDLEFQIAVPPEMLESKWQLRFNPDLYILDMAGSVVNEGREQRIKSENLSTTLRRIEEY